MEDKTDIQSFIEGLTDKEWGIVMDAGAIGYDAERLSLLLGFEGDANKLYNSEKFIKAMNRGEALADYRMHTKLLEKAAQGDFRAQQEIKRIKKSLAK